ncbi:RHS repeat-associated core domain-containing protein [Diaphorobacter caeni]|uniref:RHS repeat-associated core domain-containing protein n=1 Tax=Diaphorobacter caeni TaxID=2784387 RepID=UPI002B270404|nr:RHS repeat-associated core domain-containing protein [Diaphorobacter caeni]
MIWQASYKTWGSTVSEEWEARTLGGNAVHPLDEGDSPSAPDEKQQNLRFQGQYLDRETGLHYNTFRYYDADVGRFVCPDPIGLGGGSNLGSYSPNPISWIDPSGLYNGEGVRQLGVYDKHFETKIPKSMYKKNDATHFERANRDLYRAMKKDPKFRADMEKKYPGIGKHVEPKPDGSHSSKAAKGTTWHHGDKPGSLQLVDGADHKKYHPDGTGGRNKWGGGSACR